MRARGHRTFDSAKRGFDILASAIALVLFSPVMAVVALLVLARLGRPVIFVQRRPGRDARIFRLFKFRSMAHQKPDEERTPDADRLTPFGRRLRSTSLDELPTLFNVLKGDMSFVGPRPLLEHYLPKYTERQARRHEVRPGITGLAQVSGRNALDWGERFRLDVKYVDTRGPLLDLRILGATVLTVITREGVAAEGHATVPGFKGTPDADEPQ